MIPFNTEELQSSRVVWSQYLVGGLFDIRRFSICFMQNLVNRVWKLRGMVTVVGREDNVYLFLFNNEIDLILTWQQGPWSFEGALMALEFGAMEA